MALAGKLLGPGAPQWQRLEAICQEYLAAHPVELSESEREQVLRWPVNVAGWWNRPRRRWIARDAGFCQVPGCSRAAVHAHHVIYRSRGGIDEESNMVSLCAAHHLHGVHRGWVRVRGQAPERLTWELGVRPGAAPLAEVGVH